ncbi:hypothetical protein B0H16DRAFT_696393 [Mycena metata]|uniref:Uncharacterized protein n=1 Tax=Mycena metata TaxID=1033252 RepID=A0AAD7NDP1_9AGAR|nr:hypothetical protein B0H16DRAFT_696393 [Mycena metata]
MNFSASISICRRGLQGVYWTQRRSFYHFEPFYSWHTPVLIRKKRTTRPPFELPAGVTTLDPNKITSEQYFDISTSRLASQYRKIEQKRRPNPHMRQVGDIVYTTDTPFPPDTKGFLYFYSPPDRHPLCGCIRFRVAEDPSSRGFQAGHDLLLPHGLPWEIPIWETVTWGGYKNLLDVLAADGFAPPLLQLACRSANVERDSVFISALGQPWLVDWATEFSRIYVIRPLLHPVPILIPHPWFQNYRGLRPAPYSGRGIVSVITTPEGNLGLRVDKVLYMTQHSNNLDTVRPVDGLVTELGARLVQKSTKGTELKAFQTVVHALSPIKMLPPARADESPLEVFRHPPPPRAGKFPELDPAARVPLPPLAIRNRESEERHRALAMKPRPSAVPDLSPKFLPSPPVSPPPPTWDRKADWNPPAGIFYSAPARTPMPSSPHRNYKQAPSEDSWYRSPRQAAQPEAASHALREPPPHRASPPHAQAPAESPRPGPPYLGAAAGGVSPPNVSNRPPPHAHTPAYRQTDWPRPPPYGAAVGGVSPPNVSNRPPPNTQTPADRQTDWPRPPPYGAAVGGVSASNRPPPNAPTPADRQTDWPRPHDGRLFPPTWSQSTPPPRFRR